METHKRFTRSRVDKKIAGVCGGLGQYLHIDPVLIRVGFILLLIMGSLGFWLYILLWLLAPEE